MATQKEKEKIFQTALKAIKEKNLIFIEEVITYLPISKPTFYEYFPLDSNDLNSIKDLLNENKLETKALLRSKWRESENATLQIALYRLSSDPDEHRLLNQTYIDTTSKGEKINNIQVEVIQKPNENTGDSSLSEELGS